MRVQKCICLLGLTCVFFAQLTAGQDRRSAQVPASPNSDPFRLSVGSSFTASGSGQAPADRATVISKETIAADVEDHHHSSLLPGHPAGSG